MSNCPCGSGKSADDCCVRYHNGTPAPTALALMKSRYSAFALGNGEYLAATLSTAQRADFNIGEFNESHGDSRWLGLEVRQVVDGAENDETGTVEFVARYNTGGDAIAHHERAEFAREDGRWVFADCEMNPKMAQRIVDKVGRNDPCPCGSGKKFKKCCGAAA
jgi:SEC-C motif domain protein